MATPIQDIPVNRIDGTPARLGDWAGKVLLVVNVASQCGLTPQYAGLQRLYEDKRSQGLVVLGFPANDFGAQEPGTDAEISAFCSLNFDVKFPLFSKISVLGADQHPLYAELTRTPDAGGSAGKVQWNFEKFVVTPGGEVHRFRPKVQPDDPAIIQLIEASLPMAR